MYTMLPPKWPLALRLLPFSGRHLGFPVDDILSLNAAFRSRTIFRKSHKNTPLHLSRFQRYAEKSGLGVILRTPWTSESRGLTCSKVTLQMARLLLTKILENSSASGDFAHSALPETPLYTVYSCRPTFFSKNT